MNNDINNNEMNNNMNNGMYNNNMNNGMYNNNMNNGMYYNNMNNGMYYNNMNYNRPYKKTSGALIALIIFIVIAIIAGGIFLLVILFKNSDILLNGEWDCGDNIVVELDNKKFEMYNSANRNVLDVKGKYSLKRFQTENKTMKYTIVMNSNDRTIEGKNYTDNYSTEYEISMESGKANQIHMINTKTYNIYSCTKK